MHNRTIRIAYKMYYVVPYCTYFLYIAVIILLIICKAC